jgi:hypothetical protein
MALVIVEHPIAGHNLKSIQMMVETAYPDIIKAITKWQPSGK